mmetsp:Transcript_5515/g.11528  ORF Transcript_5515/g.11528 Transcript_5515/m.11528 type:complete len:118 (-) Transcript_5515:355-708(-)
MLLHFHRPISADGLVKELSTPLESLLHIEAQESFRLALFAAHPHGAARGSKVHVSCPKDDEMQLGSGDGMAIKKVSEPGLCATFFSAFFGEHPKYATAVKKGVATGYQMLPGARHLH